MKDNPRQVLSLPAAQALDKPLPVYVPHTNGNGSYYGAGVEEAEENHFREYLRAVRKHLWLILGLTLIVTSLTAVYMARQPDIFTAQARVEVGLENNPAAGAGKTSTVVINSPTSDPAYFNTQLQNLTGPALLRRVVKTLDLEHNSSFLRPTHEESTSTWQNLLRMVGLGKKNIDKNINKTENTLPLTGKVASATAREDLAEAKKLDPFVRILQAGLKVEPVKETRTSSYSKDTRLIDIRFTHADPQVAAKIVNALADTFALSNLEKKTENTANTGDLLQKRVAELQAEVRNGEERLVNYAKEHQILSLDGSQNTVVDRLVGLNKQLLEAENDRKTAEAAYRAAQAPGAASALAEGDAKQLQDIESKLATLKQRRQELLVENTEEWPEVKETTKQIETLEKQAAELRSRATKVLTTNLETRYRQALDKERALRAEFDRQRNETVTQNEAAINYRIIQQEIETNKQLLEGLLQRSKENDVLVAGTPNNISVVDYALAPDYPIGPQRMRSVIMAFFLSLAAGIGLAIFLEYMNDSVRSTDDVDRWLRLPSIGVIPAVGGIKKRKLLAASSSLLRQDNGQTSPELLVNTDGKSALAEAYKHLRTSVLLSTAGHAPKTLLVTSSMPSEGKTTTAVNTALSLAQTGARVLGAAMTAGDSYAWFDPQGTSDSTYYLEDIDLNGTRKLHGPTVPVISTSANFRPGMKQARTLNQLNEQSATTGGVSIWQHGWPAFTGSGRELLYDIDEKASARLQQLIASQQAAKISVNREGWYRVTQADLVAAGFNTKVDPKFLQLFDDGREVPILMNAAKSGQFSAGDSFEFYGTGLDTSSTDTNTYWLVAGNGKGLRITPQPRANASKQTNSVGNSPQPATPVQNRPTAVPAQNRPIIVAPASPLPVNVNPSSVPQLNRWDWFAVPMIITPPKPQVAEQQNDDSVRSTAPPQADSENASTAPAPPKKTNKGKGRARKPRRKSSSLNHARIIAVPGQSYPYTVELKERLVYVSSLLNGEKENFYGQVVGSAAANENLFLENPNQSAGGTAILEVALQGYTLVNHQIKVKVNDQEVGVLSFDNQEYKTAQFFVPSSLLREGANTVTLERTGGSSDFSLVDIVRLTYDHGYRANGNTLYFTAQGETRIDGFSSESVRVMDISDPFRIKELAVSVEATTGGFAATVQVSEGRNYLAFTDDKVQRPASIELDNPSTLKSSDKSADLVIVSYGGFRSNVEPLAKQRREQGLQVLVVDVQDVYDEFGDGAHSPYAVKDFLSWAKERWQKAPSSVLFVGDASLDPRNYLGNGQTDFVPTKLIDTASMETASDDWLVDFNNDGLPDMAVGRLPVSSTTEADRVVAKIVGYKPGEALQQVLMVVDKNNSSDGFSFAQSGQEVSALLPPSLTVNTINRASSSDDAVHSQIVNAVNQGPLMVNYIGHGSVEVWTGAPILSTADMASLNNSNHLPVFIMMTCLNGYYQNSARESLAEALIRDNSSGAVAVWASSGMTEPNSQAAMNQQFYRLLFGNNGMTLGEAAEKAKESVTDMDVRRTWILFGDPTMKLQ